MGGSKGGDSDSTLSNKLSTPLELSGIRTTLNKIANASMALHSQAVFHESLEYPEKKVVQYRIIDPSAQSLKLLRNSKQAKPQSQKQLKGSRTLDCAYIPPIRS